MAPPIKLLATGVIAVGILFVASGGGDYWEKQQAQRWDEVAAVVVSSSVYSWHTSKGVAYRPQINYAYAIGRAIYQSDYVRFGSKVVDRAESEELVQRFKKGTHVVAYVDPADHRRVVLDRDHLSGAVKWKVGVGLGLFVAGAILLTSLRKANF